MMLALNGFSRLAGLMVLSVRSNDSLIVWLARPLDYVKDIMSVSPRRLERTYPSHGWLEGSSPSEGT